MSTKNDCEVELTSVLSLIWRGTYKVPTRQHFTKIQIWMATPNKQHRDVTPGQLGHQLLHVASSSGAALVKQSLVLLHETERSSGSASKSAQRVVWIFKMCLTAASVCPCSAVTFLLRLSARSSLFASSISTTPSHVFPWDANTHS